MSTDIIQLALAAVASGEWQRTADMYRTGTGTAEDPQWVVTVFGSSTAGLLRREQGRYMQGGEWGNPAELVALARAMDIAGRAVNNALEVPKAGVAQLVVFVADDVSTVEAGSALYEALHGIRRYPSFSFSEVARGKVVAKIAKQDVGYRVDVELLSQPKNPTQGKANGDGAT